MKRIRIFKRAFSLLLVSVMLLGTLAGSCVFVSAEPATVATVGGVEYTGLNEAIANAVQGDTVELVADATVESTVNISDKNVYISASGGNRIKRASGFDGAIFDIDSGGLEISSGICIDGEGRTVSAALVKIDGGSFTMNSGSSVVGNGLDSAGGAAVTVNSGSFDFMGGSVSSNTSVAVYVGSGGNIRMAGDASFTDGSCLHLSSSAVINIPSTLTASSDIAIYFDDLSDGRTVAVLSGGSLDADQLSRFKLMGTEDIYTVVQSGTSIVAHKESSSEEYTEVVEYLGKKYDTLNDAINDVYDDNATLYVLKSFAVNYTTVVNSDRNIHIIPKTDAVITRAEGFTDTMFTVESGSALTLGGTLQVNGSGVDTSAPAFVVKGTFTLESGVIITNHSNSPAVVDIQSGASFVMNGGSINGNVSSNGTVRVSSASFIMNAGQIKSNVTVNGGGVYVNDATFTMNGGDICSNSANNGGGVYVAKGTMTMNGGRIYGNSANTAACIWNNGRLTLSGNAALAVYSNAKAMVYLDGEAVINVAQGWSPDAVSGYTNIISVAVKEYKLNRVVVSFSAEPKTDAFILDASQPSFILKAVGNNLVIAPGNEDDVAYFDNKGYPTLEEAFSAVPDNGVGTVYLVGDAQVAQTIVLKENQKISLSVADKPGIEEEFTQRRITRFEGFDAAVFDIPKTASLSIGTPEGKSITIDGESRIVKDSAVIVKGTFDLGVGALVVNNNFIGSENVTEKIFTLGGGIRIEAGGVCMMSGGTVQGCYASYGGGIYVSNGTLTVSKGLISSNTALFGGGVYLNTVKPETTAEQPEDTQEIAVTYRGVMTLTEGDIYMNKANANASVPMSGMGGGIYVGNGSYFLASGGVFSSNAATFGAAASVGEMPVLDENGNMIMPDSCDFILTDKVFVADNNDIYLAYSELSTVKVFADLKSQNIPIVLSLPEWLPMNMALVEYLEEIPPIEEIEDDSAVPENENEADKEEFTAQHVLNKAWFKLNEAASKHFILALSKADPAIIINTLEEEAFNAVETGKHYNGLQRYLEADGADEPVEIEYAPVTVGTKGIFTAYYEFTYPEGIYSSMSRSLTAPFPKGTYITLIDYTIPGAASYYYYKVTGEEKAVQAQNLALNVEEGADPLYTPDIIEIPLEQFMAMGTDNQYYKGSYELPLDIELNCDRMLFVVDFTYAELAEGYTAEGSFRMNWNHYIPTSNSNILCNITASACYVEYTVTDASTTAVFIETDKEKITVSYTLGADSQAFNRNCGVIVLRLNGRYPAGTYFTDEDGNIYTVATRSAVAVIPMPKDSRGNVIRQTDMELTVVNYFGTAISKVDIFALICASDNGTHYNAFTECDSESDLATLDLPARDKYSILVTDEGGEKPFYDGYSALTKNAFLEMNVKAICNSEETAEFNLFLEKKTDKGYERCALSELFKIEDQEIESVALSTGNISLELVKNIEALMGAEFKIGFNIGDKTEYIKVNVTDDR